MAKARIEQQVKRIITEQLNVYPDQVTNDAMFIEDLGADSQDAVELVMALEEEFGEEIPDETAAKFLSVGDVISYFDKLSPVKSANCDRCSAYITEGNGYAFYSSIQMMGKTIGNMFLCEKCTASVITDAEFAKTFSPVEISPKEESEFREALNAGIAAGIAESCRAHGFSPSQAKTKARELAQLYWQDTRTGGEAIKAFWTEPNAGSKSSSSCFVATACCGSRDAWQVLELRRFRDEYLARFGLGLALCGFYSKHGPGLAAILQSHPRLRTIVRGTIISPVAFLVLHWPKNFRAK